MVHVAHIPINHPLRPLYRVMAGACGAYVLSFGIAGLARAWWLASFAQDGRPSARGLHVNPAFAVLSITVGLVVLTGAVIGRNVDHFINLSGGVVFLTAGLAMMTLLRTDLNLLGFTMTTCIVSFVLGLVMFTAGLYGKTGTPR